MENRKMRKRRNRNSKFIIIAVMVLLFLCIQTQNVYAQNVYVQNPEEDVLLGASKVSCKYPLTGNASIYSKKKTPLKVHGRLSVSGTNIVDAKGKVTVLRGVSLHGIQHTNGSTTAFKDYVNLKAFQLLRDEWGVNLIRIPVYTAEGGYCEGNAESMDATIQDAVTYASKLGMYVIIDWHILSDGNPQTHQSEAKAFFQKYAKKYAGKKNIIFEICNEPNGVDWSTVKSYAVSIVKTIRKYDKNVLIVVGTPQWSQLPTWGGSSAADDPITAKNVGATGQGLAKNILYSIHFYAASHYGDIQENVTYAHNKGLPVFCTEFGICDASGNGNYDISNANKWMKLLKKYNISFACWNLSNNAESSAMFKTDCTKVNGWKKGDLTTTGAWFINTVRPMYEKEMGKARPAVYKGVDYSAVYDFTYYTKKYSAVKKKYASNPSGALKYFVTKGMRKGQRANVSFNVKKYKKRYGDLRKRYGSNYKKYYMHYIKEGKKAGRKGN